MINSKNIGGNRRNLLLDNKNQRLLKNNLNLRLILFSTNAIFSPLKRSTETSHLHVLPLLLKLLALQING